MKTNNSVWMAGMLTALLTIADSASGALIREATGSATEQSVAVTVGSAENQILIATVNLGNNSTSGADLTATYDGNPMTKLYQLSGGGATAHGYQAVFWILVAPNQSGTIVQSGAPSGGAPILSYALYSGAIQQAPNLLGAKTVALNAALVAADLPISLSGTAESGSVLYSVTGNRFGAMGTATESFTLGGSPISSTRLYTRDTANTSQFVADTAPLAQAGTVGVSWNFAGYSSNTRQVFTGLVEIIPIPGPPPGMVITIR